MQQLLLILALALSSFTVLAQPTRGIASYYADKFHGRPTSTGERYDKNAYTAASRDFPHGTILRVKRAGKSKAVEVRVNDCGPHKRSRIIDVSRAAARDLGLIRDGVGEVEIEVVRLGTGGLPCYRSRQQPAEVEPAIVTAPPAPPMTPSGGEAQPPVPEPTPAAAPALPPGAGGYAIQTGAFQDRTNADRRARALRSLGLSNVSIVDREGLLRVLVGPFPSREAAETEMVVLKDRHRLDGWVVTW